jgi:hypothetical protein
MLRGYLALHDFMMEPPAKRVELLESDLVEYDRSAPRILSHVCGNFVPCLREFRHRPQVDCSSRLDQGSSLGGDQMPRCGTRLEGAFPNHRELDVAVQLYPIQSNANNAERVVISTKTNTVSVLWTFIETLELRDRQYRMKVYKDCFVASQAMDVLIDAGHAVLREDAVGIGRDLNDSYNVFGHVMGDHLLTDAFL